VKDLEVRRNPDNVSCNRRELSLATPRIFGLTSVLPKLKTTECSVVF